MAFEIERKFLVNTTKFHPSEQDGCHILQAYLSINPDSTIRVRIINYSHAFITVKSRNHGAVRHEWEYEVPVDDAQQMLEICAVTPLIDKIRYNIGRWEVDEFHGHLEGLVIAEIELQDKDEKIVLPDFIGREVTGDKRYYNSMLAVCNNLPPTL